MDKILQILACDDLARRVARVGRENDRKTLPADIPLRKHSTSVTPSSADFGTAHLNLVNVKLVLVLNYAANQQRRKNYSVEKPMLLGQV